ncbi:hypothetical protein [Rickettsiales endosymbiont of Trichoplax sp. H2]|uniref:hypothetical protein n=1 Tax=Rickettsiales endosymbiont of Trichoplax sp. H2 TaxID=2021221 RepID=UPI0012B214EC|nr:hypothetical protein [Rickettsiales endosymbiont of Trichoplax sp. H2]
MTTRFAINFLFLICSSGYYIYTSEHYQFSWFIDAIIAASVKTISKIYIESHLQTFKIH